MSKVQYLYPIAHMSGKVHTGSKQALVHRGNSDYTYTRVNDRDYKKNPKTANEAANQRGFGDAVRAYQQLKQRPVDYEAFLQQYAQVKLRAQLEQRPCHANPYAYFLSFYISCIHTPYTARAYKPK